MMRILLSVGSGLPVFTDFINRNLFHSITKSVDADKQTHSKYPAVNDK